MPRKVTAKKGKKFDAEFPLRAFGYRLEAKRRNYGGRLFDRTQGPGRVKKITP